MSTISSVLPRLEAKLAGDPIKDLGLYFQGSIGCGFYPKSFEDILLPGSRLYPTRTMIEANPRLHISAIHQEQYWGYIDKLYHI
jgi:hypothetical protein